MTQHGNLQFNGQTLKYICVYTLHVQFNGGWQEAFAGYATMSHLTRFDMAMNNDLMQTAIKAGNVIQCIIESYHATEVEASAAVSQIIDTRKPHYNIAGKRITRERKTGPVKRNSDGTIYKNQATAALNNDTTEAAMSKHLNGLTRHIRGVTYTRVTPDEIPAGTHIVEY